MQRKLLVPCVQAPDYLPDLLIHHGGATIEIDMISAAAFEEVKKLPPEAAELDDEGEISFYCGVGPVTGRPIIEGFIESLVRVSADKNAWPRAFRLELPDGFAIHGARYRIEVRSPIDIGEMNVPYAMDFDNGVLLVADPRLWILGVATAWMYVAGMQGEFSIVSADLSEERKPCRVRRIA